MNAGQRFMIRPELISGQSARDGAAPEPAMNLSPYRGAA